MIVRAACMTVFIYMNVGVIIFFMRIMPCAKVVLTTLNARYALVVIKILNAGSALMMKIARDYSTVKISINASPVKIIIIDI
jgi:hypothetical protein